MIKKNHYKGKGTMDNLIFKYELYDAWEAPVHGISIYERDRDNVEATYWSLSPFSKDKAGANVYSLSKAAINTIINVIECNISIFDVKKVEMPFVIDGVINKFVICLGEIENEIRAFNIGVLQDKNAFTFEGTRENADIVLGVFNEISKVLTENGVDPRYLELDI